MKIDELKKHFKNTPLSELKKEWKGVKEFANVGPTAINLVKHWSGFYCDEFNPKFKWRFKELSSKNKKLEKTPKYSEFFFCIITEWKTK